MTPLRTKNFELNTIAEPPFSIGKNTKKIVQRILFFSYRFRIYRRHFSDMFPFVEFVFKPMLNNHL